MEDILPRKAFAELTAEVKQILDPLSWTDRHGREFVLLGVRIALFALGFAIFALPGWVAKAVGMIVISYFYYGITITGTHETGHRSWVRAVKWNKVWGYFFADFWSAQSSLWWHYRHVEIHHIYTNMPDEAEVGNYYYPWIGKYAYFFGLPFLVNIWLVLHSTKYLLRKPGQLALYLILTIAGWAFHVWLFSLFVPLPYAFLSAFVMRTVFAPIFVHIAIFNHIDLDMFFTRPPWLPHQSRTTRNLRSNWLLDGMGGNAFVECHVEHHLFPTLSNHILAKIRPTVMKYLQREGYVYIEESYTDCLKKCLEHYDRIFRSTPMAI